MKMGLAMLLMTLATTMTTASAPEFTTRSAEQTDSSYTVPAGATEIPSNISSSTRTLIIRQTRIRVIPEGAFANLPLLERLTIEDNNALESIGAFAFANLPKLSHILISENFVMKSIGAFAFFSLPKLTEIIIVKSKSLTNIDPDAFSNMRELKYLTISNTGLRGFPDLTKIHSTSSNFIFELQDNNHMAMVPANAFRGLSTQTIGDIRLSRNGFREVASDAFNGTKLGKLSLKGNKQLHRIGPNAFVGSSGLVALDISQTALRSLPGSILGGLKTLFAESADHLTKLPAQQLTNLNFARLTYPSHCCAFEKMHWGPKWDPLCHELIALDHPNFYQEFCSNATFITCSPMPDEFNPCEDIMSSVFLRVLIWIISVLALLGNSMVLFVLLGNPSKLTVPRFLMCHLAFADLCIGIYLTVIASVDMLTRGRYYNYAMDWQKGLGCPTVGSIVVFASELSVFTLSAITLERWHTITDALRLDRKIRLRHACVVMAAGWVFSFLAALLPLLGVSSYSKVSICLPMDVESPASQMYVVSLLLLNILAFFCVCGCYFSIYLSVRKPASPPALADARVAQRMAILIFTDFLCVAPISFFALSAALKRPLITVTSSKLLLVFFFPINSCFNPFLYAFLNRTFRRDFFLLAARFGLFKARPGFQYGE